MVDKIIKYENETHGKKWFNKIVVVAGDTYPPKDPLDSGVYEGEGITNMVLENMSGFEPIKLYESEGTLKNPRDVINAFNKGCGFICFVGHGSPSTLRLLGHNSSYWFRILYNYFKQIRVLWNFNMNSIKNKDMLPVCVVAACNNLQFDVSIINSMKKFPFRPWKWLKAVPECWGWKLTDKPDGGSIATVGCTHYAISKEDKKSKEGTLDYLVPRFFWQYGVNGSDILGEVWGKSINDYLDKYPIDWNTPAGGDSVLDTKTVESWVLFGDPSLKIGGYG